MPESPEPRKFMCPSCGDYSILDARFVQWCAVCGHGADPNPPQLSARAARRAQREQRRSLRLFESLHTAQNLRPTSATGVAVTVISTLVHLIGFAALVLPICFVAATGGRVFWSYPVLLLGILTFWGVRPRIRFRMPRQHAGLDRAAAPNLYALLDRCAAELGCAVPAKVFVDSRFNASTGRVALRRTSFLSLGVPLWTVLTGQERIALLGHELGHQVNGDPAHGIWAGSARRSLSEWTKLLDPRQTAFERQSNARLRRRTRGGRAGLAAVLAPVVQSVVFLPFFLIAVGCSTALARLDLYCGQRAEYLADELGARLAGSEAVAGLLGKLLLREPVVGFITAARNVSRSAELRREAQDTLWARVKEFADSIPETELLRRRMVDEARNTRTDRTHPATHLRAALMRERPPLAGTLKLSADEWARIDAELAPGARACARALT